MDPQLHTHTTKDFTTKISHPYDPSSVPHYTVGPGQVSPLSVSLGNIQNRRYFAKINRQDLKHNASKS